MRSPPPNYRGYRFLPESGPVTFIFASREVCFNNAVALKEYVDGLN